MSGTLQSRETNTSSGCLEERPRSFREDSRQVRNRCNVMADGTHRGKHEREEYELGLSVNVQVRWSSLTYRDPAQPLHTRG